MSAEPCCFLYEPGAKHLHDAECSIVVPIRTYAESWFATNIHDRGGKFEWPRHEAGKNHELGKIKIFKLLAPAADW